MILRCVRVTRGPPPNVWPKLIVREQGQMSIHSINSIRVVFVTDLVYRLTPALAPI